MKDVIILPDAEADILDIWDYGLTEWGVEQAIRYDAEIQKRIEGLATGLTASRAVDEIAPGLRRALAGRHVVFFREDAAAVTVVRVLHQRMDVGRA
ncbi:MAG: type II toxin-antitoxin system RelE/ParE family toxin [Roseicyclus sp.]